jgi:hypothetical protein
MILNQAQQNYKRWLVRKSLYPYPLQVKGVQTIDLW